MSDLTPAQREAVLHVEGPLLVVAGAGSGKTRVITRRVAHLIDQGIEARQVLAITFTNKAAGEMQERIAKLTGGAKVWVSTFHSFCARTLRRLGPRVGLRQDFTILDDDDQLVCAREAVAECGLDPKLHSPQRALQAIERWKDRLLDPAAAEADAVGPAEQAQAKVYAAYQAALVASHTLDFGDLLARVVQLLRDDDTRQELARRHRFLLIDEYQDTNHAQYELARLLAAPHRNLCATGDPNQSIYGWRGADVSNILGFTRDWPEARVVKLEENFRSTRTILRAANGLVARNPNVVEFELRTSAEEGAPLVLRVLEREREEGRWVAAQVEEELRAGTPPHEVAVFFRMGSLSRSVEEALLERGISYRVVGAVAFYQRREVKDLLAYLRLAHNPDDDLALLRILNVPGRGAGKVTLNALRARADADVTSLSAAIPAVLAEESVRGRGRQGLAELQATLAGLRELAQAGEGPGEVLRAILQRTGYVAWLRHEHPDEDDRVLNVEALLAAADEFERLHPSRPPLPVVPLAAESGPLFAARPGAPATAVRPAGDEAEEELQGLAGFLEHAALVAGRDQGPADAAERVSLMTIHAAKGLEFAAVIVVGLEEGIFPNSRAMEAAGGLEEERRLAYVALTRAKQRLYLSRANWRTWQGRMNPQQPSGFLFEIPPEVFPAGESPRELERRWAVYGDEEDEGEDAYEDLRTRLRGRAAQARAGGAEDTDPLPWEAGEEGEGGEEDGQGQGQGQGQGRRGEGEVRRAAAWERPLAGARTPAAIAASVARAREGAGDGTLELHQLAVGLRVRHEQFGPGVVEAVIGTDPARARVEVRFGGHGKKSLVLQYTRLRRADAAGEGAGA